MLSQLKDRKYLFNPRTILKSSATFTLIIRPVCLLHWHSIVQPLNNSCTLHFPTLGAVSAAGINVIIHKVFITYLNHPQLDILINSQSAHHGP